MPKLTNTNVLRKAQENAERALDAAADISPRRNSAADFVAVRKALAELLKAVDQALPLYEHAVAADAKANAAARDIF